jgi:hypothetical protein
MFIPMLITLFPKGGDKLHELLGEGQKVLYSPREYLNPSLV